MIKLDLQTFATGAALSNYLENAFLNHCLRGGSAMAQPTGVYFGLFTDAPGLSTDQPTTEVSGGAYTRMTCTFGAAVSGTASLTAPITFPTATANWGTLNYVGIFDAVSGGNLLYWGALTASKTVNTGDTYTQNTYSVTLD